MSNQPSDPTIPSIKITFQEVVERLRYTDPLNPTAEEVAYRQRWLSLFPKTEADILSYQGNPRCDCRIRLTNTVVKGYATDQSVLSKILGTQVALRPMQNLVGEQTIIPDTVEDYKKFALDLQKSGGLYRGMNIIPADGKLRIFFY